MKRKEQIQIQEELKRIKLLENYDSNNPEKSKEQLNEALPAFVTAAGVAFGGLSTLQKGAAIGGATVAPSMVGSADPTVSGVVNTASGALTGGMIGSMIVPGIGTAIGAALGGAAGAIMSSWSKDVELQAGAEEKWTLGMDSDLWSEFHDVVVKEEKLDGLEEMSSSTAEGIANELYNAMYGGGTDEDAVYDALMEIDSIVNLSKVNDEFGTKKGAWRIQGKFSGNLKEWLVDELTSGEENRIKNIIGKMPLLVYDGKRIETALEWEELVKTEKGPTEEEQKTKDFADLWKAYPCVLKTAADNQADWSDDFKQVTITIGEGRARFSNTGKYRYKGPQSDGKVTPVGTYSCSGEELSFEDEEDLTIVSEGKKLSSILRKPKRQTIKEQKDITFGDMTLNLPKSVDTDTDTDKDKTDDTGDKDKGKERGKDSWLTACSLASVVKGKCVIRKGHSGDSVRAVQSILQSTYGTNTDGKYGPITEEDVRKYQKSKGLYETGIVDQDTAIMMTGGKRNGDKYTDKTKETIVTKTEDVATDKDEEIVNMVTYDLENTGTETINRQIVALNQEVLKQPTKQKCIQLIGSAAAGCKAGIKTADTNSLKQCYNSYDFGLSRVARKSRRVKKCYGLKGKGNV
jgi:peptidoglycan hydrolase-like protein with peptidoglycan-binding domain